jgi:transposase
MVRTCLDDAEWASLLLAIQDLPRAWKLDEGALRCFVEAASWACRTGVPWRDLLAALGHWASVYHRWRRWCRRGWWKVLFEARRPPLPAEGPVLLDRTTCKGHRAASGAAQSSPAVEALGRSRGGLCSKLHACVDGDGAGRILRLLTRRGNHADLRYAVPLLAGIPARDAALNRGYVSAALHVACAAEGCTIHTPPKRGMAEPPPWDKAIHARRHLIEHHFSSLRDWARIALRRDKTCRSRMGFAHLAAAILNLRLAKAGHRP